MRRLGYKWQLRPCDVTRQHPPCNNGICNVGSPSFLMLSINELIDKFVKNNLMIFKSILIKVFMNIYYYFYPVVFLLTRVLS